MQLATQVDELRARGSKVETIFPDSGVLHDANSRNVLSINVMDPSVWLPTAKAGYNQGQALAEHLTDFWRPSDINR